MVVAAVAASFAKLLRVDGYEDIGRCTEVGVQYCNMHLLYIKVYFVTPIEMLYLANIMVQPQ